MIAWEESPRQFKMSKQLDEGKFGEDLARKFLNDPIIKVNHGISHYDDVTQDKSYQDKDTDFIVWKKNGKTFGCKTAKDVTDAIPYSIGSLVKDHADEKTAMRALQNI